MEKSEEVYPLDAFILPEIYQGFNRFSTVKAVMERKPEYSGDVGANAEDIGRWLLLLLLQLMDVEDRKNAFRGLLGALDED